VHDPINDDQAIVINVEGKGLVVVVGGFHLGDATPEKIGGTFAELKAIGPRLVMPAHCTGFADTRRFAAEMADQFVLNAVGTKLAF